MRLCVSWRLSSRIERCRAGLPFSPLSYLGGHFTGEAAISSRHSTDIFLGTRECSRYRARFMERFFFIHEGPRRTATAERQRQRQHLFPRRATKGHEEGQGQRQEKQRQLLLAGLGWLAQFAGNYFCGQRCGGILPFVWIRQKIGQVKCALMALNAHLTARMWTT